MSNDLVLTNTLSLILYTLMKKVNFESQNSISFESLLEKTGKVLIGLESHNNSAIFVHCEYSKAFCKNRTFLLKELNGFGVGNEWLPVAKTLQEWKDYFQNNSIPFHLFFFETEKEMYQWMLEKVKHQ